MKNPNYNYHLPIKSWTLEERPREKLLSKGIKSLTNAELLAILVRSGTKNSSAVDVAKHLLTHAGNELTQLCRFSIDELLKVKGIGEVKALSILAALELGRRRKLEEGIRVSSITCSQDAYLILGPLMEDLSREEFWILLLDRKNAPIKKVKISEGGISGTVVDIKQILKMTINYMASGIILAHNHPSKHLKASDSDIRITHKIKEATELLDIRLLDHLIIAAHDYLSFKDEGIL